MNLSYNKKFRDIFEYILVYLYIGFSVAPFFSTNELWIAYVFVLLFFLHIVRKQKISIKKEYIWFFLILVFIMIMQSITMAFIDIRSNLGTLIRFLFPLFGILLLQNRFIQKYLNIVFILSIFGLIIFCLKNLIPDFNEMLINLGQSLPFDEEAQQHFLIYCSRTKENFNFVLSNSGFAYEPGSYSIVLGIALIFSIIEQGKLLTKYGIVFILSLLSTFSTAGYIALFIILIGYAYNQIILKRNVNRVAVFFVLLFLSCVIFTIVDFMQEKIESQVELLQDPYETRGRFASAQADITTWLTNPLWGTGKSEATYLETAYQLGFTSEHRVNGLAQFLAKFGIIMFLLYLYLLYRSLEIYALNSGLNNMSYFFYYIAILSLAFSQICLQWPIFIVLLYLSQIVTLMNYEKENNYSLSE